MICDNCIHKDVCSDNDNETQRDYCTWYEKERPHGKWISCKQELPRRGKKVLFCDSCGEISYGIMIDGIEWISLDSGISIRDVVAWMPLPEPYKEERQ